ncbi:MAG: hypothetical protein HQL90_04340 [Magnetococcales bacterium]|nr:hypothetical protein [Magnetococcales bacterium]
MRRSGGMPFNFFWVEIDVSVLPYSFKNIEEVIGRECAIKLVNAFGGNNISIPKAMHSDHRIAVVIGYESAIKLAGHFGGETIYIPSMMGIRKRERDKKLLEDFDKGMSVSQLSAKYKVSGRTVSNISIGRQPRSVETLIIDAKSTLRRIIKTIGNDDQRIEIIKSALSTLELIKGNKKAHQKPDGPSGSPAWRGQMSKTDWQAPDAGVKSLSG